MTQPRLLRFWVVFVITTVPFYPWGVAVVVLTLLRVASRRVDGVGSPPAPRTTDPETSL
ncbi:hypothetical protein ACLBYD_09970 [Rhodococcus sp. C26F]